jgi:sulfite reductase (ferredoxin)
MERVLKQNTLNTAIIKESQSKLVAVNACGQHNMSEIGFQGMSINAGKLVAPALQVLLGGGILGNGKILG